MSENVDLVKRLQKPAGKIEAVLDTDAYNEIDDQFALAYMLLSGAQIDVKAVYAAPFHNHNSAGPADGMEKSYAEILKILGLMGRDEMKSRVFKGSRTYLPDEDTPVVSDAARDLAERAMGCSPEKPLYVTAIGAVTNVASAILMKPEIVNNIVVVWLGGHAHEWPHTAEFNMMLDVAAARVLFGCGAAVVQVPCMGVASSFITTGPELEYRLWGKNRLCDYLVDIVLQEAPKDPSFCWSRVLWDVTAVAWLLGGYFTEDVLKSAPIPQYDNRYSFDGTRHPIGYVYAVNRDRLMSDLFKKLTEA